MYFCGLIMVSLMTFVAAQRLDGSKSEAKCAEYKNIANTGLPLVIVGGIPATAGEFPHMVALGYGEANNIQWACGGTLISENFVLTAAHCLYSREWGEVKWARAGTVVLKEPTKGGFPQDFEIIKEYPHPEYKPPSRYNDISLLQLNSSVVFNKFVFPACLNTAVNTKEKFQATGWGRMKYLGSTSDDLLKVDLQLFSTEECRRSFTSVPVRQLSRGIDEGTHICAGDKTEDKDTCDGDSGGPLFGDKVSLNYADVYYLVGVTSFGKGCGVANLPGVYSRVSYYVPWIESIVWP